MLPVLFKVGSFPIHAWGVLLFLAFLAAAGRAARCAHRYGIKPEDIWDSALVGLLGGVIGGRLAYVAQKLSHFLAHPGEILAIWTGGMTSFGGFLGGIAAGLWAARRRGLSLADTADLAAVSLPIGYGIGRVGCFLNGCCYGSRCDLPWAVHFHPDGIDTGPVHPAQLYAAAAAVLMFLALRALESRRAFPGQLMLAFAILYGVYRFLIEFVREGATAEVLAAGLTTGQIASLVVAGAAAAFYARLARRNRK